MHMYWFKLIAVMFWSLLTEKDAEPDALSDEAETPVNYTHQEENNTTHWYSRVYQSQ